MGSTLITSRAVLLAKLQTAVGTPATVSASADAILVEDPDYNVDPKLLERKFTSADLSPFPHLIGRKLAMISFTAEVRGNGVQNSGLTNDQPRLARLLQACGYSLIALDGTAAANVSSVFPDTNNAANTPNVAWAAGGTVDVSVTKPIIVTLTKGAASAITVADNQGNSASATITTGTPITIGTTGITMTPTFTGTIPTGSVFRFLIAPKGLRLKPLSNGPVPLTAEMYFDGLKHRITDAFGSFTMKAEAGDFAKFEFEFTGQFVQPTDAALPNPTFETTLPAQVELAKLTWGSATDLVVNAWTIDQKNTITPRPDVNSPDGYKGVRITERAPEGGMDPEAMLEAEGSFWADFTNSAQKLFCAQVGQVAGNIVFFFAPRAQVSAQKYTDRDNIRAYDMTMLFKRFNGDDELSIYLL